MAGRSLCCAWPGLAGGEAACPALPALCPPYLQANTLAKASLRISVLLPPSSLPAAAATTTTMCPGKCSRLVGLCLLAMGLASVVANLLLMFPNGESRWAANNRITSEVWMLGGLLGGGLLVSAACPPPRDSLSSIFSLQN